MIAVNRYTTKEMMTIPTTKLDFYNMPLTSKIILLVIQQARQQKVELTPIDIIKLLGMCYGQQYKHLKMLQQHRYIEKTGRTYKLTKKAEHELKNIFAGIHGIKKWRHERIERETT